MHPLRNSFAISVPVATALLAALTLGAAPRASSTDPVARFTALAVDMSAFAGRSAGMVEIVVDRWSTDGERDRLIQVLKEEGPDELLDALTDKPRVGYIRTPDSIGYPLRFAYRQSEEDGGNHVTLITERYVSFWEAWHRPRRIDYPFTVVELHLDKRGEGEGKMSLATRIIADTRRNRIVLENYSAQPVLLQSVRLVD